MRKHTAPYEASATLLYLLFKATRLSSGHLRATKTRDQRQAERTLIGQGSCLSLSAPHPTALSLTHSQLGADQSPATATRARRQRPEPSDSDPSPAIAANSSPRLPQPLTAGCAPSVTQTRRHRPAAVCARPRHAAVPRADWPGYHAARHAAADRPPMGAQLGIVRPSEWLVRKRSNSIGGGSAGARQSRGPCPQLGGARNQAGREEDEGDKGMKAVLVGCESGVAYLSKPTFLIPKRA